jgi:TetR/AcrR family tetracycline transcriptional repressor
MPVTREEIVGAAIALLDEAGLHGLTLRRLAQRLGIRAPTLYWHVRDKRELLDLMADALSREALDGQRQPGPGQPWWDWLAGIARSERAVLLAHRDSALVLAGNTPVHQALPAIEQEMRALVDAGFTPPQALMTLRALGAYVVGEVMDIQGAAERARPEPDQPAPGGTAKALRSRRPYAPGGGTGGNAGPAAFRPDDFPLLLAANSPPQSAEQRFEHGLSLIIDGLRARLTAHGSGVF